MTGVVLALLLVVALLAPALRARSSSVSAVGGAVLLAYSLGVNNERAFPGLRAEPLPGELVYWLALTGLVLVAGLFAASRK